MAPEEMDALATPEHRRALYRDNVPYVFGATAALYYAYWGECFHFALFEAGDDPAEFEAALARTHERYFAAINGRDATRILELATGGGAFAEWMARRAPGEVVGVDMSDVQLARAHARAVRSGLANLRFVEHDIMRIDELNEPPFDAAVCLDAACYLPDKLRALRAVATRLRPGARLLLVDWCRSEHSSGLQDELVLEPFYRRWGIPEMERVSRYELAFRSAGFRLLRSEDLSSRARPNWERAYRLALAALAQPPTPAQLVSIAPSTVRYGSRAVQLAKEQFNAVLLAKAAADAGIVRYVEFVAERE